jgi:hypothetical protein
VDGDLVEAFEFGSGVLGGGSEMNAWRGWEVDDTIARRSEENKDTGSGGNG